MEPKNKLKPNIRVEPKVSKNTVDSKISSKKKEELEENLTEHNSLAKNKADGMESGFIKTRRNPLQKEAANSGVININQNISNTKIQPDPNKHTNLEDNFRNTKHTENSENSTNNKKNSLQITLSPSACITALVTLLVTISFIFLFGLIIGKGMVPAPSKAEPEKLLPESQIAKEKTEILPKEKLQFMTNLKTETVEKPPTDEKPSIKAETKIIPPTKIIPSTRIYDFNIRTAAFRNDVQADTLREKLEGAGFRTLKIIEKDAKGNWYFVHILLRGTETKLEEAREIFKKFAIRDSIIKEQKEVK